MKFFSYLRYFFFLASNWNVRIALHIIRNDIRGEKKYGIHTTGTDDLKKLEERGVDIDHSTFYMPAGYDIMEDVFTRIGLSSAKHFIDIGCGKGRAMCVAASMGAKKVTGIDFSKEFCEAAERNLQIIQQGIPDLSYKVYHNDAFYFEIPDDADIIFLFNPFDEVIMSGVVENIEMSLERKARQIQIVYANPMEKHLFLEAGYKQTYHIKKLQYLEAVILKKPA
ncbi:MAG: class I SAM-dependent methyltransferase [Ferruginibacter sp.]